MSVRLKGRRREVARALRVLDRACASRPEVHSLLVVGSYARGAERMASDLDVVLLCRDPLALAAGFPAPALFPRARLIRERDWGPVRERRYRLPSGLVLELGFAPLSWARVPLDPGTRRVLGDGHRIVADDGTIARAVAALA